MKKELLDSFNASFLPKKVKEPDYGTMDYIEAKLAYIRIHGTVDNDYFRDKVWQPAKVRAILAKEALSGEKVVEPTPSESMKEFVQQGFANIDFKPVTSESYDSMPQDLKEAQQRNEVRNHGLDINEQVDEALEASGIKGDFKWKDGEKDSKVIFVPNEDGKWLVSDKPDNSLYQKAGIDPFEPVDNTGQNELFGFEPVIIDHLNLLPKEELNGPLEIFKSIPKDELIRKATDFESKHITPMLDKALQQSEPSNEMIGEPEKRSKLRSSQIEEHGIVFDSKLENYMYNLLTTEGINFRFQVEYILQEGFTYRHENIRPMAIVMDFVLDDFNAIVDTKGWQLQDNKLKHKLLKKHLHDLGTEMRIEMPSSQKQCRKVVEMLRNGFVLDEPLTENAGTARKNKLKKNGWLYDGGTWCAKDGNSYGATWIMNLPKFEFEELLLKHTQLSKPLIQKVTYKEQPELFNDITEFAIESVQEHRRGSNFFRYDIIEFTKENAKWFPNVPNFEDYLGTWKTNTLIWDADNGFDGDSFSELERVQPVESKTVKYK